MKLAVLKVVAVCSALGVVVYAVYASQRLVDREVSDSYSQVLRSLLTLDAQLVEEVMNARVGIVGHYDGIAQTEAALKRTHDRLRDIPSFLSADGRREMEAALDASAESHRRAQRFIERFKSEHAVLRNSLQYLPVASAHVDTYASASGEKRRFESVVSSLVRDVLLLQVWGDEHIENRVARSMRALASDRGNHNGASSDPQLGLVLQHAGIVRDKTPIVAELIRAIVDSPLAARSHDLAATYERHYRAALTSSKRDISVLFVLALLAVASGAAYAILRLRRSGRELERSKTDLQRAVQTLEAEKEKQKELSELKSRFVSMTSHEFRTPLSVIVSSSEMVAAYSATMAEDKKQSHLEGIRTAALGMTKMLDSILLIGRSDAGMLECSPGPVDLPDFCATLVESTEQTIGEPGRIHPPDPPREAVVADSELLRHILENLLSNAVKYSPDGSPVRFDVRREGEDLVFEVADRGIGISEKDLQRLFDTFYRGSNVGKVSGTGLGLSIVKRAVDLHGGSLSVNSKLGEGTEFTVRVPCPEGGI